MICMLHAISSNIFYFLSSLKIIPFSDLNEFEEMQPIEEEEDDIWENLDAQLADTVNIIKNFNFWVSYGRSKMLSKWKINLYVKKCKNDSSSNLININFHEFFFFCCLISVEKSFFKQLIETTFLPSPNYFCEIGFAHGQEFAFRRFLSFIGAHKTGKVSYIW